MKKLFLILLALLLAFAVAAPVMAADATYGPKVYMADGGDRQVVADGGVIDVEDGGYIRRLALKVASIAMVAVNYTLSTAESLCNILSVSGSPSGLALVVPTPSDSDLAVLYTVRNAGADSAAVNIGTSGGASVEIASGKTAEVYCTSAGCYRKTGDATN